MGHDWPNDRVVRFGIFEADLRSGEVRKHGLKIKLHQQPFQILQARLEHLGEVISKEALQKRIWSGDTFVDFDQGLYNAIKKLREALGDVADPPRDSPRLLRSFVLATSAPISRWGGASPT
jgi:DNA-binding winged helix-turn-helix (wHTH) protein